MSHGGYQQYLFLGVYCLIFRGDVADLKLGDPGKPLMKLGFGN